MTSKAGFGTVGDVRPFDAYRKSFGDLQHKTTYHDPWNNRNVAKSEYLKKNTNHVAKALDTSAGGSGTASSTALVPVFVDQRIVDQSRKFTPLVELIPRVTNQGLTADYNRITDKGDAFFANPDAALDENDDSSTRDSENIKYLYSVGRVLGPMQAAMPAYTLDGFQPSGAGNTANDPFGDSQAANAMQKEVLTKSRALKEKEEDAILNGDSSTNSVEFDGFIQQQGSTNKTDKSGNALQYPDDTDKAVEDAFSNGGRPGLAVGSPRVVREIRKSLHDSGRFSPGDINNTEDLLPFGVPSAITLHTMVGPIPLIPSQFLDNTSGNGQLLFIDMDHIEMRVLQDQTFKRLANTNDSEKFMIKVYETLVLRAPQFNAWIDNIA